MLALLVRATADNAARRRGRPIRLRVLCVRGSAAQGRRRVSGDWFDGGGNGHAVDVAAIVDAQALIGLLSMVEAGALVSLGTTSNGGALGLTVTVDGRYRREYVRTNDEIMVYLAGAVPAVTDALAGARPSAAPRQRQRSPTAR